MIPFPPLILMAGIGSVLVWAQPSHWVELTYKTLGDLRLLISVGLATIKGRLVTEEVDRLKKITYIGSTTDLLNAIWAQQFSDQNRVSHSVWWMQPVIP